jgi:hypothetical protein
MTNLDTAQSAHTAATQALSKHRAAYQVADAEAAKLATRAADLLKEAAAGSDVSAADIIAARREASDAIATKEVAAAIVECGQRAVDVAELALIHTQADAIRDQAATLRSKAVERARAVDDAIEAVRSAMQRVGDVDQELAALAANDGAQLAARLAVAVKSSSAYAHAKKLGVQPYMPAIERIWALPQINFYPSTPGRDGNMSAVDVRLYNGVAAYLGLSKA